MLEAALRAFSEHGVEATTLAAIREASGASTGSIYHFFRDKQHIASALYLEGLAQYHQGLLLALEEKHSAKRCVETLVAYHLHWVFTHKDWARYLLESRHVLVDEADRLALREENKRLLLSIGAWMKEHVEAGVLRPLPIDLAMVILLGPAHEFARLWLRGRTRTSPEEAIRELSLAAYAGLSAEPTVRSGNRARQSTSKRSSR